MANYKGIKGFKVQSLASDPTLVEGQVWYNTTGNALKYLAGLGAGSWASGGAVNSPRNQLGGAGRSQTAGLIMGGIPAPTPGVAGKLTESYDGTSWTEVNDLNTADSYFPGTGSQTAALKAGGSPGGDPTLLDITETYDGISWSETADLLTGRYGLTVAGTTTAALAVGGRAPGSSALTESWNGTSWSEVNDLNTARHYIASATSGTPTAGLVMGGLNPSPPSGGLALTESYNGTSWTEVNDLGTGRYGGGGTGTQTGALFFGGSTPTKPNTESWDGTSWTEVADLTYGRYNTGFGGIATNAFIATGDSVPTGGHPTSEEWTQSLTVKTVTVS